MGCLLPTVFPLCSEGTAGRPFDKRRIWTYERTSGPLDDLPRARGSDGIAAVAVSPVAYLEIVAAPRELMDTDRGSSTLRTVKSAVIFDGDDTLWLTESLYDDARREARAIVENAGFDGARWEILERDFDVSNVVTMGHSPERFPTSCLQALDALSADQGGGPSSSTRRDVLAAAEGVFTADAPLRAHALQTLRELTARGLKLALLTKGDRAVQEQRIERSGLAEFFDVIEIVDAKSSADVLRVARRLGVDPADVVSVGNSVRSDVLPSLDAGAQAVWIPAHVWEYEQAHDHLVPDDVPTISDLAEVLAFVGR